MANEALADTLRLAVKRHTEGRLDEAGRLYETVLAGDPDNADALHHLGLVRLQQNQLDEARQLIERSMVGREDHASYHSNLGEVHRRAGRFADAEGCYRRAIELKPELADAKFNFALCLEHQGRLQEAAAAYQQLLASHPKHASANVNLGNLFLAAGRAPDAERHYRAALDGSPEHPEALRNLALLVQSRGKLDEAEALLRRAVNAHTHFAEAWNNLGTVLRSRGRIVEGLRCHENAVVIKKDYAEGHNNLGSAQWAAGEPLKALESFRTATHLKSDYSEATYNLARIAQELRDLDLAEKSYSESSRLMPRTAAVWNNLGNIYKDTARLDDAIRCFEKAAEVEPNVEGSLSNRLYTMLYHPAYDGKRALDEHVAWARAHADPITEQAATPFDNDRSPNRRIRVGYLSPNLLQHPLGSLLEPLVARHDHKAFEIFIYNDTPQGDAVNRRYRTYADTWRDTAGMTHDALADLIRRDRIDVLVDLSLHMAHNRLLTFARRPAPVQCSYLAYPATSGMKAIDFVLTDPHLDPPESDAPYVERLERFQSSYWCYAPMDPTPPVAPLPADERRGSAVTFACLNNFCKLNDRVARTWSRVLDAVPNSTLMVLAHGRPETAGACRRLLTENGIPAERLRLVGSAPRDDYLRLYSIADIALDPFPCNGHTTSLDALWMGVPVVSLRGKSAFSRAGESILTNIGLTDWLANDEDDYVCIAQSKANDLEGLRAIRRDLRGRLQGSAIGNAEAQTRDLEGIYRRIWSEWCANAPRLRPEKIDPTKKLNFHFEVAPDAPALSVCVVVKNRSKRDLGNGHELRLLPRLIESIARSVPKDMKAEIVVADFESDDWPLEEWIHQAAGRIPVRVLQVEGAFNRGAGRNAAAVASKGKVIFFCDADMLVTRELLQKGVALAEKGVAFFPVCMLLDPDGKPYKACLTGFGNAFFHREVFPVTGGWPAFSSWGGEDNAMWERTRAFAAVERTLEPTFHHQWHPATWRAEHAVTQALSDYSQHLANDAQQKAALPFEIVVIGSAARRPAVESLLKGLAYRVHAAREDASETGDASREFDAHREALVETLSHASSAKCVLVLHEDARPLREDWIAVVKRAAQAMEVLGCDVIQFAGEGSSNSDARPIANWKDLQTMLVERSTDRKPDAVASKLTMAYLISSEAAQRLWTSGFLAEDPFISLRCYPPLFKAPNWPGSQRLS